jgi:putative transposase
MKDVDSAQACARWAHFRFSVIGSLLASPPAHGQLQQRIQEVSERDWVHPTTGQTARFSFATIERWYYAARGEVDDPFGKLRRKTRFDAGKQRTIPEIVGLALAEQYRDHPTWSYHLHHGNLVALGRQNPQLGSIPSYPTVSRYMKAHGLLKQKRKRTQVRRALEARERRSYEVRHVNQLWHLDFHEGSRGVLTKDGRVVKPWLLGIMDDHSRLACHLQWYWQENAENLVHGLSQALQKRGVPRALLTDGGGAMKAAETRRGLDRLAIVHEMTLPETPEQNGKQENFWTQIEKQLLPMLEGVPDLTLQLLNHATQAWVEQDYHRHVHSETREQPIERFLSGVSIGRPCPGSDRLRDVFRLQTSRTQRKTDGTISVEGSRLEIPSRFRCVRRVIVRYARWDLSNVDLIDPGSEQVLCPIFPLDRNKNADEPRRSLEPIADPVNATAQEPARRSGMAPLLRQHMANYAASGLPPAYLPKDDILPTQEKP